MKALGSSSEESAETSVTAWTEHARGISCIQGLGYRSALEASVFRDLISLPSGQGREACECQ